MSFIVDLFKPGLLNFINEMKKNPNNRANFDRGFTKTLQNFSDFNNKIGFKPARIQKLNSVSNNQGSVFSDNLPNSAKGQNVEASSYS